MLYKLWFSNIKVRLGQEETDKSILSNSKNIVFKI